VIIEVFCYNFSTAKVMKKKKKERPVFDSIRKPTPPPSHKIGNEKAEEKIHPAKRKVKHKKRTNQRRR
jgi:hypothetical protein